MLSLLSTILKSYHHHCKMRLFHHTLLKEHQFRQLPVNDRTFVEVQESKGKDPVYKQDKETQDWTH